MLTPPLERGEPDASRLLLDPDGGTTLDPLGATDPDPLPAVQVASGGAPMPQVTAGTVAGRIMSALSLLVVSHFSAVYVSSN